MDVQSAKGWQRARIDWLTQIALRTLCSAVDSETKLKREYVPGIRRLLESLRRAVIMAIVAFFVDAAIRADRAASFCCPTYRAIRQRGGHEGTLRDSSR
jgi:hypothetical protein